MAPHWGQLARLPAAEVATFSIRPQLEQTNSIEAAEGVWGVVLIESWLKGRC